MGDIQRNPGKNPWMNDLIARMGIVEQQTFIDRKVPTEQIQVKHEQITSFKACQLFCHCCVDISNIIKYQHHIWITLNQQSEQ